MAGDIQRSKVVGQSHKRFWGQSVLIGSSLSGIYNGTQRRDVYLCLALYEISGDLRFEKDQFFGSLKPHTYLPDEYEVHLESGIVLNVFDVVVGWDSIYIKPERIFRGKRPKHLETLYMFWDDPSCKLSTVTRKDLQGPFGRNSEVMELLPPRNEDFYCQMALRRPDDKVLELGLGNIRNRAKLPRTRWSA